MRKWIARLGSMKIAIALLAALVVALAAGTLVESTEGSEAAARAVYYAPWFHLLLALFALNVLFSLIDLWPWGRERIGYLLTHGSMLVILAGALVTNSFKIEGRLALWEGEESERFALASGTTSGGPAAFGALPFAVRLDSFEIDTYPGTERPAMFRSRVTVRDSKTGARFPAVIEMNRELSYRGYRLFQSSYQRTPERDQTVLSVSRDPGQPIVFLGYFLLMGGMATVLGTRMAQRRAISRQAAQPVRHPIRRVAGLMVGMVLAASFPARSATLPDSDTVARLRRLPIQHDGRVMPFDTLAREAVWKVTGEKEWRGADPAAVALGWVLDPPGWSREPQVKVGPAMGASLGLPTGTRWASFGELISKPALMSLIQQARGMEEQNRPLPPILREAQALEERLVTLQGFLNGDLLHVYPVPGDPSATWMPPPRPATASGLIAILDAGSIAWPPSAAMEREVTYNRVRPTRLAWWILGASTLLSLLAWNRRRRWLEGLAVVGLLGGFGVMTWGLAVRWIVAGRIPASDMYESLLFLAWGVGLFALAAAVILRSWLVIVNATAMSALTMLLADRLPLDPFIHPVPPVLAGTAWLAIHVPIIMVSYSVLALGVLVAHMRIGFEIFAPSRRDLANKMNDLLYWYMHVGAFLLIAGIFTGSIWASSSWGRYWGWDPKEVWSLIAFLAYLAILHGRFDRLLGPLGVAALSIIAFWMIIMTYVGVNFVLASGLHSYGFGGSGVVRWLLAIAGLETLFLGAGLMAHYSRRAPGKVRVGHV